FFMFSGGDRKRQNEKMDEDYLEMDCSSQENSQDDLVRSADSGVPNSSFNSDRSMSSRSGRTSPGVLMSLKKNVDSFYRTPGALKFRRRCPPPDTIQDVILGLPDDVLLHIINRLPLLDLVSVMQSCKKFNMIAEASASWRYLDLGERTIPDDVIRRIIMRGTTVLRLCGTNITRANYEGDNDAFSSKLTHLDLTSLSFIGDTQSIVTRVVISSNYLTHLSLSGCDVTLSMASHLSLNCRLSHLDLSMCGNLSPSNLSLILSRAGRTLEELNVSCSRVGREGGMTIATNCTAHLLRLDLSGSATYENPDDSIDDEVVATLVQNCPRLLELHLADSPNISEAAYDSAMELRYMSYLALSRCYGIHPQVYLSAGRLKYLSIYGLLSEEGVNTLRSRLPDTKINELELAISTVARPTPAPHVTSLWGIKVRPFVSYS
ncbi:hypothetical protein PFISCL1PPCAC_5684, partial [Pristionchus fissidentatus]